MKKVSVYKMLISLSFVFGVLSFGYAIYKANYQQLSNQLTTSLQHEANAHVDFIAAKIDDLKGDIAILSMAPPIQGIQRAVKNDGIDPLDGSTAAMWQSRLRSIFRSYLQAKTSITQIRYIDVRENWHDLVNVQREAARINLPNTRSGLSQKERAFFTQVIEAPTNEVLVSGVLKGIESALNKRLLIAVTSHDDQGTLFGIIVIDVDVFVLLNGLNNSISNDVGLHVLDNQSGLLFSIADKVTDHSGLLNAILKLLTQPSFLHGRTTFTLSDEHFLSIVLAKEDHEARLHSLNDALTAMSALFVLAVIFWVIYSLQRKNARQQAALTINASENAAIIKSSQDAIIVLATDGVIKSWNKSAEQMFGYSASEALGKSSFDLLGSQEGEDEEETIRYKLLLGKNVKPVETTRKHKQGHDITVSLSASAIRNERDEIVGISEIIRDMTEYKAITKEINDLNLSLQKQIEDRTRELRESYSLQEAILNTGENMVIATDLDGVITHFNPAAEHLLGYSKEEVVGKCTPAIFHDETEIVVRAKELSKELGAIVEPGFDVFVIKTRMGLKNEHEWTYITRQGARVPVYLCASAFYDERGNITGYLGMVTNISELMEQRQQLVAFKDQLTKASEIANLGIWSWDLSDNSIYWNPKMYEIYEMGESQPVEFDAWVNMVVDSDRERALNHFQEMIDGHNEADIIFDVMTATGQRKTIHATASLEKNSHQDCITVIGINQDVSQQVRYENALKEAKNASDLANRTKSEFVANMSHEIRTPLNAMMGMLKLMRRTELNTRQQDYIERSENAAKSLMGILNDILDFSKMEAGRLELDPQSFNLADFVEVIISILQGSAGNKEVELIVDLDPQLPENIVLDSLRLQQIVLNLVGNALKFTSQGEVIFRLKALNSELLLGIEDTGIGIEQDKQKRLFQAFSQAQASTVREYGGTGLGLIISKRLVELMGGSISFSSEFGTGTQFNVAIPYSLPADRLDSLSTVAKRLNVCLVHENNNARTALEHAVVGAGWSCQSLEGVDALMTLLQQGASADDPFDLILFEQTLLDAHEGALNQVSEQLNKQGFTGQIAVLSNENDKQQALQQGVLSILKPVTAKRLMHLAGEADLLPDTISVAEEKSVLPLQGIRLLLAEDNATNQLIAKELLQSEGAQVVIANNGQEAVELFHEQAFDLVLMDIQMPVMDGYDAAKAIRRVTDDTPIIAMTANALTSDRELAQEAGMNAHVSKPFQIEHLVDTILENLSKQEQNTGVAPSQTGPSAAELQTLDPDSALLRMGSNHELYLATLRAFLVESETLIEGLPTVHDQADLEILVRSAHSIKGSAATIGAEVLSDVAYRLEVALRSSDRSAYQLIRCELDRAYQGAMVAIKAFLNQSNVKLDSYVDSPSSNANEPSLEGLIELLESSNMQAIKVYEDMIAQADPATVSALQGIRNAIQELDFKAAADGLKNVA
ncbi:Signal transduction histidine-protein kinase BarA [Marinomonas aquimarina]|uniref:Sensory/regulatory protein RpfC n=1 Tax=Marinomonas aquimarina TaxID=295068 RepID=A0A1A8T699_9GAMM|nr:PAS domain-containing hybrid sensor histidine kinase/response regulator [Marinomonas aquimarina]SBS27185.1 Signal transduction histidine-protein kinase BarA [Marinomonas aquimarina]